MINDQLIIECQNGDTKAQKMLYNALAQKMFIICYRYIKNKEDAEEILSDGFIKIFKNISRVESKEIRSIEIWIKKIMVNECLMFLRKKKMLFYSEEEAQDIGDGNPVYEKFEAEEIFNLIVSLPVGYRTIFNLYAIEGYSHKEIAQQLQITESTSRSQLAKGRSVLKELMVRKYNK